MSMRYYAVDDYGLVLDEETMKIIVSKLDIESFDEDESLEYILYYEGICEYISEFTGEASMIQDNGFDDYSKEDESYSNDDIAYVSLSKYPTLFKRVYNNMEEIIDELKTKLGEYLPKDFDYRSRIRHICGTYYG